MKKLRITLIIIGSIIGALILVISIAFIVLAARTNSLHDDYKNVLKDEKYNEAYYIDGIDVITQKVSCGYAVIEMFSTWCKNDITEDKLYDEYKSVVTSTGDSFQNEMNIWFTNYDTKIHKWVKDSELLDIIYTNLKNGIPTPIEWAALYENEWTLHYSLITGIDIKNNNIKIANPYGYYEELKIEEFLERTSFDAFKDMPLFYNFAFAFGIFEKNTVFEVNKK